MAPTGEIIINELLCYVSNYHSKSTRDELCDVVKNFYSEDEILASKTALWEAVDNKVIGSFKKRIGSKARPAAGTNVEDILDAFIKMDEVGVDVVFVAQVLNKYPKISPGDLNVTGLAERVLEVEQSASNNRICLEELKKITTGGFEEMKKIVNEEAKKTVSELLATLGMSRAGDGGVLLPPSIPSPSTPSTSPTLSPTPPASHSTLGEGLGGGSVVRVSVSAQDPLPSPAPAEEVGAVSPLSPSTPPPPPSPTASPSPGTSATHPGLPAAPPTSHANSYPRLYSGVARGSPRGVGSPGSASRRTTAAARSVMPSAPHSPPLSPTTHPTQAVGVQQPSTHAVRVNQPSIQTVRVDQPSTHAVGVDQPPTQTEGVDRDGGWEIAGRRRKQGTQARRFTRFTWIRPPPREPMSIMYATNFDIDYSVENVKSVLHEVGVRVFYCHKVYKNGNSTCAFKFLVRKSDERTIGVDVPWPPGVYIRLWEYNLKRSGKEIVESSSSANNNAAERDAQYGVSNAHTTEHRPDVEVSQGI